MNNEQMQQRIEKDLPKLEARVAVVENRVNIIEKKQGLVDSVQRRVDHIEDNVDTISKKVDTINKNLEEYKKQMSADIKSIASRVEIFSEKIRGELNRFICWVAGIIVVSLCSGLVVMFVYQGKMFQSVGQNMGDLERSVSEKINIVEKDVLKLEVKIDTVSRKN